MLSKLVTLVVLLGCLSVLGIVGNHDFEEAQRAEHEYCLMVSQGLWGAYDPNIDCTEVLNDFNE